MVRGFFGQDLSEEEVQIVIDSGIARAEWDVISRRAEMLSRHLDSRSLHNRIRGLMKAAGVAVTAISPLVRLAHQKAKGGPNPGQKRLRQVSIESEDNNKRARTDSVSNLPSEEDMSGSGSGGGGVDGLGSGKNGGLQETPLDAIWSPNVHTGPEDYTWAKLPYFREETFFSNMQTNSMVFRMTSPYDCVVSTTVVDQNAGTGTASVAVPQTDGGDTLSSTIDKARWFDFYASMYKYYHVVEARWHLTFENLTTDLIWVHQLYYNDTEPPINATNEDIRCWRNVHSHLVGPQAVGITSGGTIETNDAPAGVNGEAANNTNITANYETANHVTRKGGTGPILQLSGSYKPGQYSQEIHLDAEIENWSLVSTNPSLPERLEFRIKGFNDSFATNAANHDRPLAYRYMLNIEYLVEFKELETNLRWPVQRQPLIATIRSDATSTN